MELGTVVLKLGGQLKKIWQAGGQEGNLAISRLLTTTLQFNRQQTLTMRMTQQGTFKKVNPNASMRLMPLADNGH